MTHRQIETSREIRLWARDIIIPTVTAVVTIAYLNPELRTKMIGKVNKVKGQIKTKFKK